MLIFMVKNIQPVWRMKNVVNGNEFLKSECL